MADVSNPIPSPQPGDSDDVELALETAQRMYRTGDNAEALKWLRRAANAAEEAGDDMRQLQLARLAADLAAVVNAPVQVMTSAPSVAPNAKASGSPSGAPPSRLPQPPTKQAPQAPPGRGSSPPPAPSTKISVAPATAHSPVTTSGGPPPLPSKSRPAPPSATPTHAASDSQPPPRAETPSVTAPKAAAVSIKPKAPESAVPTAAVPSARPGAAFSVGQRTTAASTAGAFIDMGGAHGTVRVSVRISARDENLYIVRPLAQGQRPPAGAREAQLVFDQDGASGTE
jgi:hypothetical protein